ncbi:MAG: transcriptional repressor LexA [Cryobacterium sp.]|nr:transcriptional repressor LexA [Oligoflexia bacterium]
MLTPKQKAVLEFIELASKENGYAPSQQEIAKHFGFKSLGTVQNYLVRLERHGFLRKAWNAKRGMSVLRQPLKTALRGTESTLGSSTTTPISASFEKDSAASLIPLNPADRTKRKLEAVPSPSPPASRSPEQTESSSHSVVAHLPLLGKVAAGLPIEYAEYDQTVEVPLSLFSRPSNGGHRPSFAESHYVLRVKGDSMIGDGILDGDYVIIEKKDRAEQGQTVVAMIGNEATIKRFYRKKSVIELRAANPAYDPILIDSLTETRDFRIEGVLVGLIRKL